MEGRTPDARARRINTKRMHFNCTDNREHPGDTKACTN